MTPEEKAKDLVVKYGIWCWNNEWEEVAKKCALIAVDEILNVTSESYDIEHINWWKEVKQEIEKL